MKRKLCSVLLALCMVLTLLPVSALAEEVAPQAATKLPAAVDNVITLTEDVSLSGDNTLNLADKTVNTAGHTIYIVSGTTTVTGGSFVNSEAGTPKKNQAHSIFVIYSGATLNINGSVLNTASYQALTVCGTCNIDTAEIKITSANNTYDAYSVVSVDGANALFSMKAGSITMEASTAASDGMYGIYASEGGSVVLGDASTHTGPTVSTHFAALGVNHETSPSVWTIYGGNYTSSAKATNGEWWKYFCGVMYLPGTSTVDIYGGTFSGGNYTFTMPWADADVNLTIHDGVFTETDGDSIFYYRSNTAASTSTAPSVAVSGGSFAGTLVSGDKETKDLTISAGTFTDLANAVAYAADGATIKLADNVNADIVIPAGKTVTLDLNGKTLTNVSSDTITNNGTLTITGSGTVDNVTHAKAALINYGTATLNGGNFTRSKEDAANNSESAGENSYYTILNDKGGDLTINDGVSVTNVGHFSSMIRNGGTTGTTSNLLINGGSFSGGINTIKNAEGGILTIKGGDFSNTTQYVIMNWSTAEIYDGTFEANSTASAVLFSSSWNSVGGTLNFYGGNVKTTSDSQKAIRDYYDANNKGSVAVTGGIFTVNPTAYVADTHIARKDGDAQYTVIAKSNLTSGVYTSDPSSALAPGYVSYKNSDDTYTVYYPVPVTPGNTSSSTTKNPDGSTTTTTTDKTTGTVTETTKNPDGSTTTVETKKDGSVTETNKTAGGSVGTVKTDANGNSEISASISAADVNAAAKKNEPVAAPVSVAPAASPAAAPVIKLSVPASAGEVSVVIPVTNAQQGTVAIKVNPDGTEEIIKTAVITENGLVLGVKGSMQIKVINNSKNFADTVGHWAASDVDFVSARELFTGTAPQTFSPESATTRGMVVTVLARLAGESTDGGANWYDKGCAWAVTNGVSDGTDPNGTVTREQLAAMLYRYFGSPAVSGSLSFADASSVSEYAHDAMQWCVNNGIINGMDGLLNPQGQATRAQVSAMFARYIHLAATK